MTFIVVCLACGRNHDAERYRVACDRCGGLLGIEYGQVPHPPSVRQGNTLRNYSSLLPIRDWNNFVTLGEGDTPVIDLPRVGSELGLGSLFAKLEFLNPTGSFKDRGNAVQVTVLKELGVRTVADLAGGNAGHSFASYCARAGIKFVGFAHEHAEHPKLRAVELTGAELHWINGDRDATRQAMADYCDANALLNMQYGRNPYFVEGQKTIAYEIFEQMNPLPKHIVVPVGNGSIAMGLLKGFGELRQAKKLQAIPRVHAVQSAAFQPVRAALEGIEWKPGGDTVATGIRVKDPPRLQLLVEALKENGGAAVAVTDDSVLYWHRRIVEREGLFVEPTSATVLPGAHLLMVKGVIHADDDVLLVLTGSGFKEPPWTT